MYPMLFSKGDVQGNGIDVSLFSQLDVRRPVVQRVIHEVCEDGSCRHSARPKEGRGREEGLYLHVSWRIVAARELPRYDMKELERMLNVSRP